MEKDLYDKLIISKVFGVDISENSQEMEILKRLKLSRFHVNLERRYLSKSYSSRLLSDVEWHKEMHFLYFNNFIFGKSYVGNKNFKKYYPLSNSKYNEVCKSLEYKGFIQRRKMSEKPGGSPKDTRTETSSFLAPVYDPDKDILIKKKVLNTNYYTNINKVHFAEIPKNGFNEILKDRRLNIMHKRLIFKLYRFNKYQLFKGVDPNFIFRKNGKINMNYRLLDDLRMSRSEVKDMLDYLERYGYIFWNKVNIYEEVIDCDKRLRVSDAKIENSKVVEVITPSHQLEREVLQW